MRQNAKWREARLELSRIDYATRMPDLASVLQISQAQVDKVFDIFARESLRIEDLYVARTVSGNNASMAERRQRTVSADEELTELLGAEKAERFHEYQSNGQLRSRVDTLQAMLAGTPAALRPEQLGALAEALLNDRTAFRAEGGTHEFATLVESKVVNAYMDERAAYAYTRGAQAHQAAASVLSPAQLERFDELWRLDVEQLSADYAASDEQMRALKNLSPASATRVEAASSPATAPSPCTKLQRNSGPDMRKLFADRGYRAAQVRQQRAEFAVSVLDQIKVLRLSRAEGDKLLDMLAEQRVRQDELMPPPGADDGERRRAFAELRRKFDGEREKLLGAEKFEEWKAYRDSRPARDKVYLLRSQLAASLQPLRGDQIEPLVAAVDKELKRLDEESSSNDSAPQSTPFSSARPARDALEIDRELNRFTAAIERTHDAVSLLLMPEQLARWDRMMELELDRTRAEARVERLESDLMREKAAHVDD